MTQDETSLLMMESAEGGHSKEASASQRSGDAALPHVCFVSMTIYPTLSGSSSAALVGGAEVQQTVVARALAAEGMRVSVLTGDFGQPEVIDCGGVRVHRVRTPGKRGIKGLRFIHPHMTDVVSALRRIDPDVVYFRVAGFRAAAAAWYARMAGKAFVYACAHDTELAPDGNNPPTRRDAVLFHFALRSADAVLVQNVLQRQLLSDHFGKVGLVIPNCYAEEGIGAGSADGHVLWVGTVKEAKFPETFIELARRHPTRRFRMVGGANPHDAAARDYFERIRRDAAALPNLDFVGHVPFRDVGKHFDDASLLVNTSAAEGFPNTFLQAWIRGVPTVSFVNPAVMTGQTGTIVCRDVEDMSSQIGLLTSVHAQWSAASAACKKHFDKFHGVGSALQAYRDLFGRLARPQGRRA